MIATSFSPFVIKSIDRKKVAHQKNTNFRNVTVTYESFIGELLLRLAPRTK